MNITFLIGNGFDLSLGLKTRYTDFYKFYKEKSTADANINKLKIDIDGNSETWADAELALGQYTQNFSQNTISYFNNCYDDFSINLSKYLKSEEDKIANITNNTNCSNEIKNGISRLVIEFPNLLRKGQADIVNNLINHTPEMCHYEFLNFNYTNCFDKCLATLGASSQTISYHTCNNTRYGNSIDNLIHIHGTTTEDMIFGVNDESQIANKDLLKDRLLRQSLIKPVANEASKQERDKQGTNMINESRIVCVFGMSLGKTDTIWWNRIGKWLQSNNMNQLIIMDYCPNYQPILLKNFIREEEKIQNLFLDYTDFDDSVKENLMKRIHIIINEHLFNINSIKKLIIDNGQVA